MKRLLKPEKTAEAFERLKMCKTTNDEDEPMSINDAKSLINLLYTDACNLGLGAVLTQEDEDKTCRPVAFYSKKLTISEAKYAIGEKKRMAIVFGIEN